MKTPHNTLPYRFMLMALLCLWAGMFFGLLGGVQYMLPNFLKEALSFVKVRPMHVTLVVSWILLGAVGGVYRYISEEVKGPLRFPLLADAHFVLWMASGAGAVLSYLLGIFGGREYMEYAPWLSVPILAGWVLFAVNYFATLRLRETTWPLYLWMWGTGILFFILTFTEANLWLIPWFRENVIRDITVQWKAMGALVGSWNMLVYGTSTYLMYRIQPGNRAIQGRLAFALYFLGLVNLLFGWGHHTFIVPAQPWVRHFAYLVSMSEWLLLMRMFWFWKKTLLPESRALHIASYRFLVSAQFWILVNLFLALLISIPAINFFTHGTHITVAHSMGTTIGINTSLLMASLFFIWQSEAPETVKKRMPVIQKGMQGFYYGLLVFFVGLIMAGYYRSRWMYAWGQGVPFSKMHSGIVPVFAIVILAGLFILGGIVIFSLPMIKWLYTQSRGNENPHE